MLTSLLSLILLDPTQPPPPDECVERPALCRSIQQYDLLANGRSVMVDGGAVMPWMDEHGLLLFAGESVVLDVETVKPEVVSSGRAHLVLDDAWTNNLSGLFKGAEDGLPREHAGDHLALDGPSRRLRISLRQAPGSEEMLLTVENGYEGTLSYTAAMMVIGERGGQWVRTSVCSVPPGIFGLEHWPHAIVALSLSDFQLGPKGEAGEFVCR